jgi:hypothetical protein
MLEETHVSFNVMYSLRCAIESENLLQIHNIFTAHKSLTPDSFFHGGSSALHYACSIGAMKCVSFFLTECRCNPNSTNSQYGMPPAHMAAIPGRVDIIEVLFKAGADLMQVDNEGENILHKAVLAGDLKFIKQLIKEFKIKKLLITPNKRGREPAKFLEKLIKKRQHPKQLSRDSGEADDMPLVEMLEFMKGKAEKLRTWENRKSFLQLRLALRNTLI